MNAMKSTILLGALVVVLMASDSEAIFGHSKKKEPTQQQTAIIQNYVPVGQAGPQYGAVEHGSYYPVGQGGYAAHEFGHHGGHNVGHHGGHNVGHQAHNGGASSASASASTVGGAASASASATSGGSVGHVPHQQHHHAAEHGYYAEPTVHHGAAPVYYNQVPTTYINGVPAACSMPPCYGGLSEPKKHNGLSRLFKKPHNNGVSSMQYAAHTY